MQILRVLMVSALTVFGVASSVAPSIAQTEAQSIVAIRQLEAHWSRAEATGDSAFLENFLMPDYRSVNTDGSVHDKARIIAGALRPKSAAMRNLIENYSSLRHVGTSIVVHGDTAIVTFYSERLGQEKGLSSSDILVNVGGQWRALYSAHTDLKI